MYTYIRETELLSLCDGNHSISLQLIISEAQKISLWNIKCDQTQLCLLYQPLKFLLSFSFITKW